MRLICPNCGAQYAVADDVIPTGGRDVQCSNCQHTWFETPGASASDTPPAPRKPIAPEPPKKQHPETIAPFSGSISDAFKDSDPEEYLAPAPQRPAERQKVDPSVADILREEAALEAKQRRTETPSQMESQSDLGLTAPPPTPPKSPEPPVSSAPTQSAPAAAAATAASVADMAQASRRDMLPDIEEINSSLRSDEERASTDTASSDAEAKRKSFRRGFLTMLLLILLLVLLYIFADTISAAVPTLADPLSTYVDTIDKGRIWLDDNVQNMLSSIESE